MKSENNPSHPKPGEPWDEDMADWYVERYGEHPLNALAVEAAALVGTETVVDIGCGSGAAVRAAEVCLTMGKAIGVDPSPAMVKIAKSLSQTHIEFIEGSAELIPLDDMSVDVVLAVNSLHHWYDVPGGLLEVARVLNKTGRLILVEEIFEDEARGMDGGEICSTLEASSFRVSATTTHELEDCRAHLFSAQWVAK